MQNVTVLLRGILIVTHSCTNLPLDLRLPLGVRVHVMGVERAGLVTALPVHRPLVLIGVSECSAVEPGSSCRARVHLMNTTAVPFVGGQEGGNVL